MKSHIYQKLRRLILNVPTILILIFLTNNLYADTTNTPGKTKAYRYTVKMKFKKVKSGEDIQYIYYPLPRTNDYQLISNFDTHGGQILNNYGSIERYVRYIISDDLQPADGEWGEVIIEFDYTPTKTEYKSAKINTIYEYDTTSDIYKRYTSKYYEYFDTENATIKRISEELWGNSADVYDYARKCYDYVNDHFSFKDNPGMWNSMADIIKYKGGDCGNLSSIIITLLRCKNIPARLVLTWRHAWGEFYLENYGWIPVDPTLKTFGKVTEGYGLVRSNEIVYIMELPDDNRRLRDRTFAKHHLFYPSHMPYECDEEVIFTRIKE
ncbi:MAG: transglutaminase domain-containing protein [Bacteroidetes bacterium]|jgi:hypothetical protein|nr:transglutaminase domain-containing protein [Bacteroidota bacterium]